LFNNATAGGTGISKCFFGWDQKTNERSVAEIEVVEGTLGLEEDKTFMPEEVGQIREEK
jgi:hypothetical protein